VENFPWIRSGNFEERSASSERLCDLCRRIDFHFLFSYLLLGIDLEYSKEGRKMGLVDGIFLGSIADLRNRPRCSFCNLVIASLDESHPESIIPSEYGGQCVECFLWNTMKGLGDLPLSQRRAAGSEFPGAIQLCLRIEPPEAILNEPELDEYMEYQIFQQPTFIHVIADESDEAKKLWPGRRVSQMASISQMASWITSCNNALKSDVVEENRYKISTYLIDVNLNCLVGPVRDTPYVALSYVWGSVPQLMCTTETLLGLQRESSLSIDNDKIPRTIRDAMLLCKQLQYRYLWVDSLCIVQDSPRKHELIRQMNKIYHDAEFSIIAAAGLDAGAGLPGLSTTERAVRQKTVETQGLTLASTLPSFDSAVNSSTWNCRSWTLQERILSQKKLIFSHEQIYFECEHGRMTEDFCADTHDYKVELHKPWQDDIRYTIKLPGKSNLDIYCDMVKEYTKRSLSYEEDIIAAFEGISNELSEHLFCGNPFLLGIPLPVLDIGLLWQPASKLRRRRKGQFSAEGQVDYLFASWSWAGWIGKTHYPAVWNLSERTVSRVEWLNASRLVDSKVSERVPPGVIGKPLAGSHNSSAWQRIVKDYEFIYYVPKYGSAETLYCHPIASLEIPTHLPIDWKTQHLHFIGETARLTISGDHAENWATDRKCKEGNHHVCQLSVFDNDGYRAGIVIVDGITRSRFKSGLYSFIKLSQTTFASGRDDPAWDEASESFLGVPGDPGLNTYPTLQPDEELFDPIRYDHNICWCLYNVLMVEWQGQVAYRLGIGQIHIHSFDQASPRRMGIELG
jgi:hypothetical protein